MSDPTRLDKDWFIRIFGPMPPPVDVNESSAPVIGTPRSRRAAGALVSSPQAGALERSIPQT